MHGDIYGQVVTLNEDGLGQAREHCALVLTPRHEVLSGRAKHIESRKSGTKPDHYPVHPWQATEVMASDLIFAYGYGEHNFIEVPSNFKNEILNGNGIANYCGRDPSVIDLALGR